MDIFISKSRKTICFSEPNYENGLEVDSKFGFLKVDPEATAEEALETAKSLDLVFSERPQANGNYNVILAVEETIAEEEEA